jgi:hypothetical protein
METITNRNTQAADETAAPSNFSKSQSLRLDKQIIRTLTGAELKLVGGGRACDNCSCGCHSQQTTQ